MVNKNSLQDLCSGPEFAIGEMYAIRQFRSRLDSDGKLVLTAVMHEEAWTAGVNHASCVANATSITKEVYAALSLLSEEQRDSHGIKISAEKSTYSLSHADSVIPKPDCTCGYYAYHDLDALEDNAYSADWTGVVRVEGRIVIGEKGLRAERAEIVALVQENRRKELGHVNSGWTHFGFTNGGVLLSGKITSSGSMNSTSISYNSTQLGTSFVHTAYNMPKKIETDVDIFVKVLEKYVPGQFDVEHAGVSIVEHVERVLMTAKTASGKRLSDVFDRKYSRTLGNRFLALYTARAKLERIDTQRELLVAREKNIQRKLTDSMLVLPETRYWSAGMFTWLGGMSTIVATGVVNPFLITAGVVVGSVAGWFLPSLYKKIQAKRQTHMKKRIRFFNFQASHAQEQVDYARTRLRTAAEVAKFALNGTTVSSVTGPPTAAGTLYTGNKMYSIDPASVTVSIESDEFFEPSIEEIEETVHATYSDVVVFKTVREMLREFPLTGPEEFRDSAQDS